MLRNEFIEI